MICPCPGTAYVPTIQMENCPFDFEQIQMIIFGTAGVALTGTSNAGLDALSTWTAQKALTTNAKLTGLLIAAPELVAGDENIYGENSNDTPDGAGVKLGEYSSSFNGNILQQSPAVIRVVRELECRKDLGAFFVNGGGRIFGRGSSSAEGALTATGTIYPIPVTRFSVKSPSGAGVDNPTLNAFSLRLPARWEEYLAWVTISGMVSGFPTFV